MDENSIKVPSKCTKVVRNNNLSEREKEVNNEQCTGNSNMIHGTMGSYVSIATDLKICLDLKVNLSKYMNQI